MNHHTTAAILAQVSVLNSVVAEVVALLPPDQKAVLRDRLQGQAKEMSPLPEFEPDYSEDLRARVAEWLDALATEH